MNYFNILIFALTFWSISIPSSKSEFTQKRNEELDNGNYSVEWEIDYENEKVRFNVTVKTKGWIGFGISPNGGMVGADIVIGGVLDDGEHYFSDRHANAETLPIIDESQDWEYISSSETGEFTSLQFSRKFDTCDNNDVVLSNDTTSFIWAYSPTNSDTISYHLTTRGSLTVQPLDPEVPDVDLTTFDKYYIKHIMTMLSQETTYWCTIHKSPVFSKKHHIVAFEPLLNSTEALAHTHHYNIFRCTVPSGEDADYFEQYIDHEGGECYVPNPVIPSHHCQTMFYNWAVGGRRLILPQNIGYPIGETGNEVDYYMFEIHYNNPQNLENITFETGATIYYTDEEREHDAGLMVVAHHTSISLTVPPNTKEFKIAGHCDPYCTQNYLPEDGINVFAIFLHAHLSGRRMRFRHFRGDVELPWAANDATYDFEFQQTRPLSKELKIERGDHLAMECIFDSTWNGGTTVIGGLSTSEEMCQSIFWYYPRAKLRDCRSEFPVEKLFQKFGIESANRSTPYEDAIITAPSHLAGMKYTEVLNTLVNWTQEFRDEFQEDVLKVPHEGVCWTPTETHEISQTTYPEIREEYQPVRHCNETDGGETTTESGESTTNGGESTTGSGESTTDGGESTTRDGETTTEKVESTTETGGSSSANFNLFIIILLIGFLKLAR